MAAANSGSSVSAVAGMIWLSMLPVPAILFFVLSQVAFNSQDQAPSLQLYIPFIALSFLLSLAVIYLRGRLHKGRVFSGIAAAQARARKGQVAAKETQIFPLWILAMGLSEAVAVLGFVHGFQAQLPHEAVPFYGVSLLLTLSLFPRIEQWNQGAQRGRDRSV